MKRVIRVVVAGAPKYLRSEGLRSLKMSRPRHLGSSPSLTRSLSRLSSSSSFQVRQSNSRIYTFLVAGALVLFATVALLQVHLLRAPQGSKLSPLENGKPGSSLHPCKIRESQLLCFFGLRPILWFLSFGLRLLSWFGLRSIFCDF